MSSGREPPAIDDGLSRVGRGNHDVGAFDGVLRIGRTTHLDVELSGHFFREGRAMREGRAVDFDLGQSSDRGKRGELGLRVNRAADDRDPAGIRAR